MIEWVCVGCLNVCLCVIVCVCVCACCVWDACVLGACAWGACKCACGWSWGLFFWRLGGAGAHPVFRVFSCSSVAHVTRYDPGPTGDLQCEQIRNCGQPGLADVSPES